MERIRLGHSEVEVSRIALGAWAIGGWMWGGADRKDALRALRSGPDHGITTVDTAPVYGFGRSEDLVGEAVRGSRDRYEILTKCGLTWKEKKGVFHFSSLDNRGYPVDIYKYSGKERILEECEGSLRRLGTDYIDLYQVHWPDESTPIEETMEALMRLQEQGKIRTAGVSNYNVEQINRASHVASVVSNQVPYSMVRRDIEKDMVPWCLGHDCSILAYSPLQRGLLTGKITPETRFGEGDSRPGTPHFRKENIIRTNRFLDSLRPMAESRGASLGQLVIAWTLRQPGISVALVGARNEAQVVQNAGASGVKLSQSDLQGINDSLSLLDLVL
jgi:aryl-alcohol dehydrogenase-like predicted oxidoreductase